MTSSTRRAMGPLGHPAWTHPPGPGTWPVRGNRPLVGLTPASPQKAAGRRTLPKASLPKPKAEPPTARSADSPPLLPPGVRVTS
jgi:hypothetical protein